MGEIALDDVPFAVNGILLKVLVKRNEFIGVFDWVDELKGNDDEIKRRTKLKASEQTSGAFDV